MSKKVDPIVRFEPKWILSTKHSYKGEPCWVWQGSKTYNGYGRFWFQGKHVMAHCWSWEYYREPIPAGLEIDHLCRTRHCVNHAHLEPVIRKINGQRGNLVLSNKLRAESRTHCAKGHPYSEENTSSDRGCRICLTCKRASYDRRRARMKAGIETRPPGSNTHCRNGHPYNEKNTLYRKRRNRISRICRECKNESARRFDLKLRSQVRALRTVASG